MEFNLATNIVSYTNSM